jgi:hypothetical protein
VEQNWEVLQEPTSASRTLWFLQKRERAMYV